MDVTTQQYINSPKVTVSFEVSSDDWCLIQQSESWKHIQNFLEVSESKGSQMCLTDRVMLLEKGEILWPHDTR
nr:MAG TPA: hypothetical protein [Caudoviricetes sp.]